MLTSPPFEPLCGQTALFALTGFYAKALPALGERSYAIVLNTNLGANNAVQTHALNSTLAWIAARHATAGDASDANVYLLGHHPSVMRAGTACPAVPAAYRTLIKGVFAGHVHFFAPTTDDLFTQVGAVTQHTTKPEDVGFLLRLGESECAGARGAADEHERRALVSWEGWPARQCQPVADGLSS